MCHSQRKTVSILTMPNVYSDLALPCTIVRKNLKLANPLSLPCQKISEIDKPSIPPLSEKNKKKTADSPTPTWWLT